MRQEKQLLLDDLKEKIEESSSFVVIKYGQLNSTATTQLRDTLFDCNADFEVVKKRIFIKAAKEAGIEGISIEDLQESIGVLFSKEDPIPSTKAVFEFAKENKDTIEVVKGHFDGALYDSDAVEKLSKLPGKDEMRASLLGLFEAPMSQSLAVMEALLTSVIHCVENKRKNDEEQS